MHLFKSTLSPFRRDSRQVPRPLPRQGAVDLPAKEMNTNTLISRYSDSPKPVSEHHCPLIFLFLCLFLCLFLSSALELMASSPRATHSPWPPFLAPPQDGPLRLTPPTRRALSLRCKTRRGRHFLGSNSTNEPLVDPANSPPTGGRQASLHATHSPRLVAALQVSP